MLLPLAASLLTLASPQGTTRTETTTTTTRRTVTYREPTTRVTVNAGDRVRIVLTNLDGRAWTAIKPITKSVILMSSRGQGKESTFEYTTSAAARSTLEFRHSNGRTREVKLTVADRTPARTTPPVTNTTKVPPAKPPTGKVALTITEAQADKTVTVRRGTTFELRLEANATTGYEWRFEPLPEDLLSLKSSTYVTDPARVGIPGAGGTQIYRFVAANPGSGDIDLVYERSFDKGKGAKRFHFVLQVI